MTARYWTAEELDAMAGAYYRACHQDDCSDPWETLPDWRRWRHRRAVRALLAERERIVDEQMTAFRARRTRSVRVA